MPKSTYLGIKITDGIKVSFSIESRIQISVTLGLLVIHANGIAATKETWHVKHFFNTFITLISSIVTHYEKFLR